MTDETTLNEIKAEWQHWKGDTHRWRSSNAMVRIADILTKAENADVK